MILEVADITIQAGKNAEFDAAIERGVREVISNAVGFKSFKVQKGIENPQRYLLMIEWETLENHTVDFRNSPAFLKWREIVSPYFAAPPAVEHFTLLTQ
jgi:heme-degrading monooxygenase HmoA